jgi:hypothetical protein
MSKMGMDAPVSTIKLRQGKAGGYPEYLSSERQRFAAEICDTLDPRFGYLAAAGAGERG